MSDIVERLEHAIDVLNDDPGDPIIERVNGANVYASDFLHDAIIWIERLRADNTMMANALAKKIGTEHLDEIARQRAEIEWLRKRDRTIGRKR